MVIKHVYISGKVQGVYFRESTKEQALKLGVSGWVRNLPDGRVEALFRGEAGQVQRMLEWCWQGPPASRVDNVLDNVLANDKHIQDLFQEGRQGFRVIV